MTETILPGRFAAGKLQISKTTLHNALQVIRQSITSNHFNYICVTNVRTAWITQHDEEYLRIQNHSLLTLPDGMPLVWMAHRLGFREVRRVTGLELMKSVFGISLEENYSHYFYGSTPETISRMEANLRKDYPLMLVKKLVSPAFRALEDTDIDSLVTEINLLRPTFFWIGLGAPKQSKLAARLQPKLKTTICIGTGLAFDYLAGTVSRAPAWMQRCGLEWLFRTMQQPAKSSRILRPFLWFVGQYIRASLVHRKKSHGENIQ